MKKMLNTITNASLRCLIFNKGILLVGMHRNEVYGPATQKVIGYDVCFLTLQRSLLLKQKNIKPKSHAIFDVCLSLR